MKEKLKGCRPSKDIVMDFTNECAKYGAAQYRIMTLTKEVADIKQRLDEINLELNESRKQEAELAKKATNLQVVGDEVPESDLKMENLQ